MFQSSLSVIGHLSGQSLSFSFPGANVHGTGAGQRVAYAHHSVRIVNPVCQNITVLVDGSMPPRMLGPFPRRSAHRSAPWAGGQTTNGIVRTRNGL